MSSVWYVGRCLIAGKPAWAAILNEQVRVFPADASLADCLKPRSVEEVLSATIASTLPEVHWLAPIDQQEVWAAGVTYLRSKQARMDESERAASVYDLVYNADRPEIFFKATANRVVGPKQPIRIRVDSKWNVPEPELVVALDPQGNIIGYTIGNDMSSRDIEGANHFICRKLRFTRSAAGSARGSFLLTLFLIRTILKSPCRLNAQTRRFSPERRTLRR